MDYLVYKITLVSTHGTGKTTLASGIENCLKQRGVEARHIREMATDAIENGLPINEETSLEAQLYILHSQFRAELKYCGRRNAPPFYEVLICDRSFDNYCYLENSFGQNRYALNMVLNHLKDFPYDRIYFLPIVDSRITSGSRVRAMDSPFQKEMDRKIRIFLRSHKIEHTELPQPAKNDEYRQGWLRTIVNQTLRDLNKPRGLYIE